MDEIYFAEGETWGDRLARWKQDHTGQEFLIANASMIDKWIVEHGVRIAVNIGADALLAMLTGDYYRNKYDLALRVGGPPRAPSVRRFEVDRLLGFSPDGRDWYYGAIALGGTGVRFYGEYCMVLAKGTEASAQLLDRNSYDLTDQPLAGRPELVAVLRGAWTDLVPLLTLKVLPALRPFERLVTVGLLSELVLHDEDFVEVQLERPPRPPDHRKGFEVGDIEEIRQPPEEIAQDENIESKYRHDRLPTGAELVWATRRSQVARLLAGKQIPERVVTTGGRGARWR